MSSFTIGQMNQLGDAMQKAGITAEDVTKLGQDKKILSMLLAVLRDKAEIKLVESEQKWREEDGIIYFSVVSDGTTGEEWIKRLENKGFGVGFHAKSLLISKDFQPTKNVKTEVAVLKGLLFEDENRGTKNIRAEAEKRGLTKSNAEIACLIREMFTNEEIEVMGLWYIVVMHEPIKDYYDTLRFLIRDYCGTWRLLGAGRNGDGCWLSTCYGSDYCPHWQRDDGFAFVISQVDINA